MWALLFSRKRPLCSIILIDIFAYFSMAIYSCGINIDQLTNESVFKKWFENFLDYICNNINVRYNKFVCTYYSTWMVLSFLRTCVILSCQSLVLSWHISSRVISFSNQLRFLDWSINAILGLSDLLSKLFEISGRFVSILMYFRWLFRAAWQEFGHSAWTHLIDRMTYLFR